MLNRRLIIEHANLVKHALLVRYPPTPYVSKNLEDLYHTVDQVVHLGKQAFDLDNQIQDLRRERNELSDKFPKASKEEKLVLRQEVSGIKIKISELENLHKVIEKECQEYELLIPNIPDPGVPLWSGISDDNREFYQSALRIVHSLINEYDPLIISDEIAGYTKHHDEKAGTYYVKNE